MRNSYKGLKALVHSIVNVGWIPVDAMMVWEHPQAAGKYVVVEGNARTTALRAIRRDHDRELKRLAKARGRELPAEMSAIQELEESVEALGRVSAATREIEVYPVAAHEPRGAVPLAAAPAGRAPHLARAAVEAHATNVYIYSLYKQIFEENYGDERFRLEEPLLREAGALVSLHSFKVRRAVQAVVAFNRFRAAFDDRLPEGERLGEMDQNYFLYLFEPGHARDQFGLGDGDLWLDRDMEEVLFRWAFAKPREQGGEPQRAALAGGHPHLEQDRPLRRAAQDALLTHARRAPPRRGPPHGPGGRGLRRPPRQPHPAGDAAVAGGGHEGHGGRDPAGRARRDPPRHLRAADAGPGLPGHAGRRGGRRAQAEALSEA